MGEYLYEDDKENNEVEGIPKDWTLKKQGEVSTFYNGRAYKQREFKESGTPVVRIQNLTGGNNYVYSDLELPNNKYIENGDLIYAWSATFGPYIWHGSKSIYHYHIWKIEVDENLIDKIFYYYRLHFISNETSSQKNGAVFAHLTKTFMENYKITLPPLAEQRKIAAILTSVDDAIEKTEAIIAQTEKVKKGLEQKLLTQGIGHTKFKQTEIGEIPEEWSVQKLRDIADPDDIHSFVGGPFGSDLKSNEYTETGVRILQLQNIKEGFFSDDYKIFTSEEKADELLKCNIFPGDVIIAKMAEPVARACIVPPYHDRYVMASDGIRLAVNQVKYIPEFINYAINALYFRKQAEARSTGSTRLRIGLKTLRNLKLTVPPYKEQREIVNILSTMDNKITVEQQKLTQLQTLKKGLMQVLLTGKVRVKVDEEGEVVST